MLVESCLNWNFHRLERSLILFRQNMAVFGTCNPYVLVKIRSAREVMSTSVRVSGALSM